MVAVMANIRICLVLNLATVVFLPPSDSHPLPGGVTALPREGLRLQAELGGQRRQQGQQQRGA